MTYKAELDAARAEFQERERVSRIKWLAQKCPRCMLWMRRPEVHVCRRIYSPDARCIKCQKRRPVARDLCLTCYILERRAVNPGYGYRSGKRRT